MYTTPITFQQAAASTSSSSSSSSSSAFGGGTDGMFMQLLVTQLQNQDPTSPMDPSTFVNQLVEVNSLDQLTQINQLLQNSLGTASSKSEISAGAAAVSASRAGGL